MTRFFRYVFWLIVAVAVVYGGYYAYENWWNEGLTGSVSKQATEIGKTATQKAGEYAKSLASTTETAAGSFLKNQVGNWVSVVGEQLTSLGANLSGATSSPSVSGIGGITVPTLPVGNVPTPTSSVFDVPPPPATIMISVNEPLSFSINSGQIYKADWGDGNKDQGATIDGTITILHHGWAEAGDYIVRVSVGNSVSSNIYSFPIRVYQ